MTAGTHTVIVGSGIIGISTAYYLSLLTSEGSSSAFSDKDAQGANRKHNIHLVDPAPVLFKHVASGNAGGFLARNWFSSSVAELGALSFDLHKELAEQFDGRREWGWSKSTVINLDTTGSRKKGETKRLAESWDWIQNMDSRAPVVGFKVDEGEGLAEYPPWLNSFSDAQPLADRTSTAQLDPLRLCNFLLDQCRSRGTVQVHNPAFVTRLAEPTSNSDLPDLHIEYKNTSEKVIIPCDNLIVTSGPWTSSVLKSLLPNEPPASFPAISSLSGASIVIRSNRWQPPQTDTSQINALFLSKHMEGFAPVVLSRVGGDIYIAGLNNALIHPPSPETYSLPSSDSVNRLVNVAKFLCDSHPPKTHGAGTDFEVIARNLCFRPTTPKGMPVIGQIPLRSGGMYGKKIPVVGGQRTRSLGYLHGPWNWDGVESDGFREGNQCRREKAAAFMRTYVP